MPTDALPEGWRRLPRDQMPKPAIVRYHIVPCRWNPDGTVHVDASLRPPYGYHHLHKVYADGSFGVAAHLDGNLPIAEVGQIAQILAGDLPITIEVDDEDTP